MLRWLQTPAQHSDKICKFQNHRHFSRFIFKKIKFETVKSTVANSQHLCNARFNDERMTMADKKLFLVRNEAKAADLRPHFSDEWVIKGIGSALSGQRFSVILVADQDDRYNTPAKWAEFMGFLRTKLTIGGKLIEVY